MLRSLLSRISAFRESSLLSTAKNFALSERGNAHRAAISGIKRAKYVRQYYVTLLQPDGSTVQIRAPEPMDLIQMPFNLDTLTDDERRQLEMKRHKTQKVVKKQETVKFNADEYVHFWKKGSKKRK